MPLIHVSQGISFESIVDSEKQNRILSFGVWLAIISSNQLSPMFTSSLNPNSLSALSVPPDALVDHVSR